MHDVLPGKHPKDLLKSFKKVSKHYYFILCKHVLLAHQGEVALWSQYCRAIP